MMFNMTLWNFLVIVVLCVSKTQAKDYNFAYPHYAPCKEEILSGIKQVWEITGIPRDVTKMFKPGEPIIVSDTTFDLDYVEAIKCGHLEVDKLSMNVTFLLKNNKTPIVLNYNFVENEDGSITGTPTDGSTSEDHAFHWYTVYKGNGFVITYSCSNTTAGSSNSPLAIFWVSKSSLKNAFTITILNAVLKLMESWGFKFHHTYRDTCFSDENV